MLETTPVPAGKSHQAILFRYGGVQSINTRPQRQLDGGHYVRLHTNYALDGLHVSHSRREAMLRQTLT